ncbi:MAG: class I SAM-dependent methyltransferase [Candidatus Rokubacteria bacterium]|nr:class I SAM-dependent methyltransferase [Candidatus Rokubacteria bacterium]
MTRARALVLAGLDRARATRERAAEITRALTLGLLRRAELEAGIVATWTGWATSGDGAAGRDALFPWEIAVYDRVLRPADRILVIGCGTGRDLIALLGRGYRAKGLDLVPDLTAEARARLARRGLSAPVVTANIRTAVLTGEYDVFIFSWFCYSYLPESHVRVDVLRSLRPHLAPGGRIVISYIPDPVGMHPRSIRLARAVARLTRGDWRAEDGDVFIATHDGGVAFQHHFTRDALEAEARAAGFRVLEHYPGAHQPTLVLTA